MSYRRGYLGDRRSPSCVYVGSLPDDVRERELEDLFLKFGRIVDIDVKKGRTSNGTAYAFVEFESVKDAIQAVERRHGYIFGNHRLRVERTGERKIRKREPFGAPPQRTDYRVVVTHLPDGCRWQHLKDHMRRAGDVGYANVEAGRGIVEYMHYDDMMYALDKLDATEMVGPYGVPSIIKVREDDGYGGGGYGFRGWVGHGGRGGREPSDFYSRRKFRSRSIEKDYRRSSASAPYDDKSLKRRSSSEGRRYANQGDHAGDKYNKNQRSYSRSRGRGGEAYGSVSRSRSRSRSVVNSRKLHGRNYHSNDDEHVNNNSADKKNRSRSKSKSSRSKSRSRSRSRSSFRRRNNNRDVSNSNLKEKVIGNSSSYNDDKYNSNDKMHSDRSRSNSHVDYNSNDEARMNKSVSSRSRSSSINKASRSRSKNAYRKTNSGRNSKEDEEEQLEIKAQQATTIHKDDNLE